MVQYNGAVMGKCARGHARPVGSWCTVCSDWNQTPWHRQLDEVGKATCPNGHNVTPTDGMSYRGNRRWCTACQTEWNETNHAKRRDEGYDKRHGRNGLCNAQRHPWSDAMAEPRKDKRTGRVIIHCKECRRKYRSEYNWRKKREIEQNSPLADHHIDWVVALHLVRDGADQLHSMRRGTSWGPTIAEKWVAYCTWKVINNGREPEYFIPEAHFAKWRDDGLAAGFVREVDIWSLLGSLADKEYLNSTLLFTTEK